MTSWCERCKEYEGRTRDHIFPKELLKKYGRRNRLLGSINIQNLCRPCHDIKEGVWRDKGCLVDFREDREARQELVRLLGLFRLPFGLIQSREDYEAHAGLSQEQRLLQVVSPEEKVHDGQA